MAYFTGAVNSYADLLNAVLTACVAEGWSLSGSILSKGPAFLQIYSSTAKTTSEGPGIVVQGGTGVSGGLLSGASVARPRLGPLGGGPFGGPDPVWPAVYHIHVLSDPDEVYVVLNFSLSRFYWLAFGISDNPWIGGSGLWITANAVRGYSVGSAPANGGYLISDIRGALSGAISSYVGSGPWWANYVWSGAMSDTVARDILHCSVDGEGWKGGSVFADTGPQVGSLSALQAIKPLPALQPNAWNGEAVLLPIHVLLGRASQKCSPVLEHRHARYLRMPNHEPGDIIVLGSDQWKVYPFHMKNASAPDGASTSLIDHTGTFGWAIRYDGP